MEKFAVDLDKVLDEFEKNEEEVGTPSRQPSSQTSLTTFLHNLDPIPTPPEQHPTSALLSPSFESLFTAEAKNRVSEGTKLPTPYLPEVPQNQISSPPTVEKPNSEKVKLEDVVVDPKKLSTATKEEHSTAIQSGVVPQTHGMQAPVVNGLHPTETTARTTQDEVDGSSPKTDQNYNCYRTQGSSPSSSTLGELEEKEYLYLHKPCLETDIGIYQNNTLKESSQVVVLAAGEESASEVLEPPESQISVVAERAELDTGNLQQATRAEQSSNPVSTTSSHSQLTSEETQQPEKIQQYQSEEEIHLEDVTGKLLCEKEEIEVSSAPESDIEGRANSDMEIREHVLVFKKSKERLDEGECKMEEEEEDGETLGASKDEEKELKPLGFCDVTEMECTLDNIMELEHYLEDTQEVASSSSDSLEPLMEPSPEADNSQENVIQKQDQETVKATTKTQLREEDEEEDEGLQSAESPSQEEGCSTAEETTSSTEEASPRKSVPDGEEAAVGNHCRENRAARPTFLNLPESQSRLPSVEMPPEPQLGKVKPVWVPDSEARNCMLCNTKFTVIRRRHHCRTCGKVLCSQCCNQRTKLPYLQNKEGRVCQPCFLLLSQEPGGSAVPPEGINSPGMTPFHGWSPSPNHPQEYCSTLPPHQQVSPRAPPTVMVPVGVLKSNTVRGSQSPQSGEPKQVMFSDGIRPGGDLQDSCMPVPSVPRGRHTATVAHRTFGVQRRPHRAVVTDTEGSLPPLVLPPDVPSNFKPDPQELFNMLLDGKSGPLLFALTKNLFAEVKLVTLSCCLGPRCWSVASQGLRAVGQDEVLLLLERESEERAIPRCAFRLLRRLWDDASRGQPASSDLGHVLFPEGLFGSRELSGFLLVRPTFQCLDRLSLPAPPFLLALLIQRWEVPWAKVFPLRLALRLGAEFRRYPCPAVSCRSRKPVYGEVGHTIMSVLADLRNFQFTVPVVPGVVIHMLEGGSTEVRLPRNRWEAVRRLLAANEHVVALGGNFSAAADSHLVCFQREDGSYHTQAINIQHTSRKVIGASFIVFSGALKSVRGGPTAKVGLVEDGLLIQLSAESLASLRTALRAMEDYTLMASKDEMVSLIWVEDDRAVNIGVKSPIDGRPLDGVESVRIHTATDFASHHFLIRWTEVFFFRLEGQETPKTRPEGPDPGRVAEAAAEAFCQAVAPHLATLGGGGTRVGLRLALGPEKVEYESGANGQPLPPSVLSALDTALIPLMSSPPGTSVQMELHFHILYK